MAIREILEVPDPRLKTVSQPVEAGEFDDDLRTLVDDDEITGLIDGRILIRAEGGERELVLSVLETMDFEALEDFGG